MTSPSSLESIADFLRERTGLHFPPERAADAEAGVRRAARRSGLEDPAEFLARLASGELALDPLVEELTVRETYFFREPGQFEFIRKEALRSASGPRVWSAGCATGEEAYSLAILLEEQGFDGRVLATDLCRSALARGRAADYSPWSLRGADEAFLARYFTRAAGRFRLVERIRERVDFEYLNLALDCFPSFAAGLWGMDLILCRNVLIYFDGETIARVARRLFDTLADGGWLVTGPSDPPLWKDAPFEVLTRPEGLFYRRNPSSGRSPGPVVSGVEPESGRRPDEGQREAAIPLSLTPLRDPLPAPPEEGIEPPQAPPEPAATLAEVKAAANRQGASEAERLCRAAVRRHPLSVELHFLQAALLLSLGREEEAERALRRVLYLDRSLAAAHFTLGVVFRRRGELGRARKAFARARELCAGRPGDEAVPLGEGERVGRLAESAAAQVELLEAR